MRLPDGPILVMLAMVLLALIWWLAGEPWYYYGMIEYPGPGEPARWGW